MHYITVPRPSSSFRRCSSRMHLEQKTKFGLPDKKKCRPQGGSTPSLRPRTRIRHHPVPSTTPTAAKEPSMASAGPSRSGTTIAADAATRCVAVPELPIAVLAPALDAPVILRSAASLMHPEDGARCPRCGFLQAPHRSPDLPAAVLAACLARATADAHTSPAAPPLWSLRGWAIPQ
jgi:hypothetical protein